MRRDDDGAVHAGAGVQSAACFPQPPACPLHCRPSSAPSPGKEGRKEGSFICIREYYIDMIY